MRGDTAFAEKCVAQVAQLKENIENNAWDGEWYRRAYFDNGEPLGSASNLECQIDSIPQSWSVLSGAGDPKRSRQAMEAVNDRLVRREQSLIQLFDPPFDKSPLDPGYIKGYVPGVRENGGQYTHAAIWTVMAFAALGDSRRAWELLSLINPLKSRVDAGRHRDLQSRAVCRRRRCVRRRPAHRSRWVDVVHRISRMDVPAYRRVVAWPAVGGR